MPIPYITVFTPAFNRKPYLRLLYESLVAQDFDAFEWVVVDDGSTDGTEAEVAQFINEGKIPIRYHRQDNAGKHAAINQGVALAEGELFFIVDSDDTVVEGALAVIAEQWKRVSQLPNASDFAGICGTRIRQDGGVIGGELDYQELDVSAIAYRFQLGYEGDRAEVLLTSIMADYPYPVVKGERFCADALVWNRIALSFRLRFLNDPLIVCEYLPDGITDTSVRLRKNSPQSSCIYYAEMKHLPGLTQFQRLKAVINFWRFGVYDAQVSLADKYRMIDSKWSMLLYPAARFWKMLNR